MTCALDGGEPCEQLKILSDHPSVQGLSLGMYLGSALALHGWRKASGLQQKRSLVSGTAEVFESCNGRKAPLMASFLSASPMKGS